MTEPDYRLHCARIALSRLLRNDSAPGPSWTFHQCMDKAERDAFDAALVEMKHPLASEGGTQEQRFLAYVEELHKNVST